MRSERPFRKQPTSPEIVEELLRFIQSKWYVGDPINFTKDRPRLLEWVVLKLAVYLEDRAVTVPAARYLEIVRDVILMEAVQFGRVEEIKYRPAWLGKVVELHLDHHGEEYYAEGKSLRSHIESALLLAGKPSQAAPDPVRDLARASTLLKPQKKPGKAPVNDQLTLI